MRKRIILMLSLALITGGVFALSHPVSVLFVFVLSAFCIYERKMRDRIILLGFLWGMFALGIVLMSGSADRYEAEKSYIYGKNEISFSGKVTGRTLTDSGSRIILSSVRLGDYGSLKTKLLIYVDSDKYSIGDHVSGFGQTIEISEKENDGGFDEASYLRCQKISGKLSGSGLEVTGRRGLSVSCFLDSVASRIRDFYEKSLPGEEGGILAAMCLGQKSSISADAKELFSSVGLGHIFAISGLHISLIGMSVFRLLRKRGVALPLAGVMASALLIMYGIMVGPTPSSIRAIGMFIIYMAAQIWGMAYDMATAGGILLMTEYIENPLVISNTGMIMSFLAVFFIACFLSPVMDMSDMILDLRMERRRGGDRDLPKQMTLSERMRRSLISSFLIQLVLMPVVCLFYYRIPGYALLLNMILLPFVSPLVLLALLAGLLSFWAAPVASFVILPCHYIVYAYEAICDLTGKLPGGSIVSGFPGVGRCLVFYAFLAVVFLVWRYSTEQIIERESMKAPWRMEELPLLTGSLKGNVVLLLVFAMAGGLFFARLPEPFSVTMLSVGQGDGICIDSGRGHHVFVDGGSSSKEELGKYVMGKYLDYHCIRKVDVWFITHFDLDHISGCRELIEDGYKIGEVIVSKSLKDTDECREFGDLCSRWRIPVRYMKTGDVVRIDDLEFLCLGPDYPGRFEGANENSLVLWMKKGVFDAVFTGDMGSEQEKAVLSGKYGNRLTRADIEVLKAAHHGSASSNCSEWLGSLSPDLCIISAGKNNRYGHPSRETVERLEDAGIPYYCTIDWGQIRVEWKDGNSVVEGISDYSGNN